MGKILLIATIAMISIIINPNMIRFGNFQNLYVLASGQRIICGTVCYTWFASTGQIQMGRDLSSPHTTSVDMNNGVNFLLCQNVSYMQSNKTYIFTFDMLCDAHQVSCSMWVIINDQVVNGSNHTSYNHFTNTVVGYFNSTQSNNKICFRSKEIPTIVNNGPRIDNITLNLFNDKVPCNVSGCQSCVLNFPNSCYICQTDYVKQVNQVCTSCLTIISNCIRCQRIINQYKCLQCSSQFLLNNQRNFCYSNKQIFFSSQVLETASIDNSLIVKTNLSIALLIQAGFSISNLPSVTMQINGNLQQNLRLKINEKNCLEIEVNLTNQYQNFNINIYVEQGFVQINDTYFSIGTYIYKKPSIFLSENQIAIFKKYNEVAKPFIQNLDASLGIIKNSGLGFFVANIFNYLSLMTFYEYLNTYQPKNFRLFIESLSSSLSSFSLYSLIGLQTQVYEIGQYQVSEKIKAHRQEWSGPTQDGFSTNFYKNNLQPFTMIVAFVVRLILCWLLYKIFKISYLKTSNSERFISISQQFQTIIPVIVLPSFNLMIQSIASRTYAENINTILQIILLFICLLTPFVHLVAQLHQIQQIFSKDRIKLQKEGQKNQLEVKNKYKTTKNDNTVFKAKHSQTDNSLILKEINIKKKQLDQQQKKRKIQAKFKLVQRLKLLSIPIFVVFQQALPFILINLCLILTSFVLSLKLRKYLSMYQFIFNSIISLAWVLLHCSFCMYFIIQNCFFEQWSISAALQISKYVSYCGIAVILLGAAVQILDCLIGIFLILKQIVTYVYQKYKKPNKIACQDKNQTQIKRQNYSQSENKKQFNLKVKQQTEKHVKRQNVNNTHNPSQFAKNQGLFYFHQPLASNKKEMSKLKPQTQANRKIKNVNKAQIPDQPAKDQCLFYFYEPQLFDKKIRISNLKNQIQKIKKTQEQKNNYKLRLKFQSQK